MNRNGIANNNERVTNDETRRKMAEDTEFGPRKTIIVLAIVAGCFAILWPKIFYPMISTPVSTLNTPTEGPGCCDVIFESDVNTVDIMQEMCKNILRHHQVDPRVRDALQSGKLTPQSASFCRDEVLARCGIDLSSFLAEKERLGKTYKQVLEEIRSFNSSLCLKMQFGVPLSQLGTPHLIRYHILMPHSPIRQERRTPPHAGGLHPALRERGRAIPSSHIVPKVSGRPDHVVVQKMRPPLGAAGRVVPAPSGNSSMGIIMPLYTLGIVLFFLYTIAKVMRKNEDNTIYAEYQNPAAEREFRNKVFSPEALSSAITGMPYYRKERRSPSPMRPTPTIEELQELDGAPKSNGPAGVPSSLKDECLSKSCCSQSYNGVEEGDETSSTVKVMGMEMTACCEGGQKISRPTTPIISQTHSQPERELTPPKPIFLEGALPPQCELLVTDSETQAEQSEDDTDAPETEEKKIVDVAENCKRIEEPSLEIPTNGQSKMKPDESEEEAVKTADESEEEAVKTADESEEDDDVEEDEEDDKDGEEEDEDSDDEAEEEEEEDEHEKQLNKVEDKIQTVKKEETIVTTEEEEDDEEEEEEESEDEEEDEEDDEDEEEKKVLVNAQTVVKESHKNTQKEETEEEEDDDDDDEEEEEDEEEGEESSEEDASDEEAPKQKS